jgi:NADH dehydrogenase FAD-containing subunit
VLVLCTGAHYNSPWRDGEKEQKTYQERDDECKQVREQIKNAKSILIVGGGATGVESAGYIAEKYSDKKIGICQRGDKLVASIPGAH